MHRLRFSLAFLLLVLLGCNSQNLRCDNKAPSTPTPPAVTFPSASTKNLKVIVDLACKDDEHSKGLMYVKKMAEFKGMLFMFAKEDYKSFWMKNTYIPLDMIHMNAKGEIVGIVENAQPHDLNGRGVGRKAKYVLEVNAFFARKHGVEIGHKVVFQGTPFCKDGADE